MGSASAIAQRGIVASWLALGAATVLFSVGMTLVSPRFGYDVEVADMPVQALVAGLLTAGLVFAVAIPRAAGAAETTETSRVRLLVAFVLLSGLTARLVLFASEPMLEDDYQRYLWDGAVTASGLNPYAVAPADAVTKGSPELRSLAAQSGLVRGRINHPELTTVYPPVAQAAFVLAHVVQPWSLTTWRCVLLGFDLLTVGLILLLLRDADRSPLWAALYWWNPVLLKEIYNSAHMDVIALPFVLGALALAVRQRGGLAVSSLALATGAKIWPLVLLPLVLRAAIRDTRRIARFVALFAILVALLALPVLAGGIGEGSGLYVYADRWKTNSALFPVIESAVRTSLTFLDTEIPAGWIARGLIASALAVTAVWLSIRPIAGTRDLMARAALLVAALVVLSPAQFPWYGVWFAPFLAFQPWLGFLVLTVTAPLYYSYFHFAARGEPELFKNIIVWIEWVPVWIALAAEALWRRMTRTPPGLNA